MFGELLYRLYSPAVEIVAPDEHVIFDELSRTMQHITRKMASRYRHAYRPVHAKSHGILTGTLQVLPDLPEHLAQGLFARPGSSYPTLMRLSTNPGDMLTDKVSSPRGLAVKIMGVDGEKTPNHSEDKTQDFVMITGSKFTAPDPAGFLKQIQQFDKGLDIGEGGKEIISTAARAANTVLKAVHLPSGTLEGIGASATHPLGEAFGTLAPLRFGNYICKLTIGPGSDNIKELAGKGIDLDDYNALELLIQNFMRSNDAVWDVKVQLALDEPGIEDRERKFSIEDASREWPEEESPYQLVGRIFVPAQETYSDERQTFVDERLSFNPWHALAAHQPLGGIMRSRLKAYEQAIQYRAKRNDRERAEPDEASEIPA